MDVTGLVRAALLRVRHDPRWLGATALVVVLLAAAVLDVPARLGGLAPDDTAATPAARPTTVPTTEVPDLTSLVTADNEQLSLCTPNSRKLARCGPAPALAQGRWLNTPGGRPVALPDLRGQVVVVDFFAASCANCRRDSRYVRAWEELYGEAGLEVVGVHVPEFAFEKDAGALADRLRDLSIRLPVLMDDSLATLTDYRSPVLPSKYLVDRTGEVRAISFGEGGARRFEQQIRELLTERDADVTLPAATGTLRDGIDPAPGTTQQINLGESRGRRYDNESDTNVGDDTYFRLPPDQPEGTFSFGGRWRVETQLARPRAGAVARVSFRARAAYQLVSGRGTLEITTSTGERRVVRVDGAADLRQVYEARDAAPQTLTVRYVGDLQVYAFSFG